ncbi:hypothetical protein BH11MYX1_BH11MYX1_03660 [soil metagenome]
MRAAFLAMGLAACAMAGTPSGSGGGDDQAMPDGGATSHVCTVSCDDSNACTTDSCELDNMCAHTAVACDDGDACTTDTCDLVMGCAHANLNHGTQAFTATGAIQTFTVPSCVTSLHVVAAGAQGGGVAGQAFTGGLGATLEGDVPVASAQAISIVVGGVGLDGLAGDASQRGGTGGGGSFVVRDATILFVAAGGGGAGGSVSATNGGGCNGGPGLTTQDGAPGSGMVTGGAGGTAGGGGVFFSNAFDQGCTGGAGYAGNGVGSSNGSSQYGTANQPGLAFVNGSAGGAAGSLGRAGGFGGGGAAGFTGGGGGGYSGGGAGGYGTATYNGGGGGSINNGTNAINTPGNHVGAGTVVLTW